MSQQICIACQFPIPSGEAVIRTRHFERRAWHRECWEAAHPVVIPTQRGAETSKQL